MWVVGCGGSRSGAGIETQRARTRRRGNLTLSAGQKLIRTLHLVGRRSPTPGPSLKWRGVGPGDLNFDNSPPSKRPAKTLAGSLSKFRCVKSPRDRRISMVGVAKDHKEGFSTPTSGFFRRAIYDLRFRIYGSGQQTANRKLLTRRLP